MKLKLISILLLVFLGVNSALAQDEPVVQELADGVYSIFVGFYNSLVVTSNNYTLITDPANPARAAILKEEIAKLTDTPVNKIVLTHEHFDHIGGTEVFENAEVIAQENIRAVLPLDPLGITPEKIDVTFESEHVIKMGSKTIELKHIGAGDGVATTIIYLPDEDIVVTADLYEEEALTRGSFLDDSNLLGNRAILNEVAGWDLKHAINAHSTNTDPEILRVNAKYYNDLYDAVFPTIQETVETNPAGMWGLLESLPESVELLEYESWGNYDQLPQHVRRMMLAIIHGG